MGVLGRHLKKTQCIQNKPKGLKVAKEVLMANRLNGG